MVAQNLVSSDCATDAKGFLNIGLEQMFASFLNQIQQVKIGFVSVDRSKRNATWLRGQFT